MHFLYDKFMRQKSNQFPEILGRVWNLFVFGLEENNCLTEEYTEEEQPFV